METALHILAVLLLPPLLIGIIVKTKAAFGGRTGGPVLQLYYDLFKLAQKGSVFSQTATWVFRAGPVVGLATTLLAALVLPLGNRESPLSFTGDMLFVIYLFGLARFFTTAAALDTGSAFEGMGSAREATYACMAEPALLFGFLVLARLSGALTLSGMFSVTLANEWRTGGAALLLVFVSWYVVLLAENCRIPFDDPNTHLELTMIHEVMVLDHSGPALAMILYGAALKLFLYSAMIVRLALPLPAGTIWASWGAFLAGLVAVTIVVGVTESIMARLRLKLIPGILISACVLAAFGLVLILGQA